MLTLFPPHVTSSLLDIGTQSVTTLLKDKIAGVSDPPLSQPSLL